MKLSARIRKSFPAAIESAGFTLDVELDAEPGLTVIFGASGSGKSLTLDCLAGFVKPDAGRILLGERLLFDGAARVDVRPQDRELGYVFQNLALFPHMTVRENLAFAAERRPRLERHRRVTEMMERFHLSDIAGRRPREISGGQRQRCSIARALIAEPRMLLFDEPSRGLDAGLRGELHELLRELRATLPIPLLLVTHDLDEAVALGNRMLVYENGAIAQSGTPQTILSRPASVEIARLLGQINVLPVEITALDPGRRTSRLRTAAGEINGPYFPGHLIGDRATLLVRADDLRLQAQPGENRIVLQLEQALEQAHAVELRFTHSITVLTSRHEYELRRGARDWFVEFPVELLRLAGPA